MQSFIHALVNSFFSKYAGYKNSLFSSIKNALVFSLLPFIFTSLFLPLIALQESLIFSISSFFGDGVLVGFLNMFWSVHVSICISVIYSFKLTEYFHHLYSSMRKFQFQTIGGVR